MKSSMDALPSAAAISSSRFLFNGSEAIRACYTTKRENTQEKLATTHMK
jgi:hypothetical protein